MSESIPLQISLAFLLACFMIKESAGEHMDTKHTPSDLSGIARAQPVATAPDKPDALVAFEGALEDLLEFTAEDAIQASSAMPGGRGCYDPDTTTADKLYAVVMDAARKAFLPPAAPIPAASAAEADNGLCTVRLINARCGSVA